MSITRQGNVFVQTVACPVAVNCVQSAWADAGACDPATGKKTQKRTIVTAAAGGGTACGPGEQLVDCKVDCKLGPWGEYGSCANGKKTRTRQILQVERNGGAPCNPEAFREAFMGAPVADLQPPPSSTDWVRVAAIAAAAAVVALLLLRAARK